MHCPFCQAEDTKVIDSRLVADGSQTRRRRECEVCHSRFTTFETADLAYLGLSKMMESVSPLMAQNLSEVCSEPLKKDLCHLKK